MPKKITITVGGLSLKAIFNKSKTAKAIEKLLPLENYFHTWGNEFYFNIPLPAVLPPENPTTEVAVGDIGYWRAGSAIAIFFGPTPLSTGDTPVPASEVEIIGKITDEPAMLKDASEDTLIRIEKG